MVVRGNNLHSLATFFLGRSREFTSLRNLFFQAWCMSVNEHVSIAEPMERKQQGGKNLSMPVDSLTNSSIAFAPITSWHVIKKYVSTSGLRTSTLRGTIDKMISAPLPVMGRGTLWVSLLLVGKKREMPAITLGLALNAKLAFRPVHDPSLPSGNSSSSPKVVSSPSYSSANSPGFAL